MKVDIEVDDETIKHLMSLTGAQTEQEAIIEAIIYYRRILSQKQVLELRGKVKWEGDLDEMRSL